MPPTQTSEDFSKVAIIVAAAGVVVGLGHMPYGYYPLLRLVLCGVSLYLLLGTGLTLVDWQRWTLGASAVLYNPVLPVRLGDKGLWTVLNLLTLVLFGLVRFRGARH
jgi:hypothetical protein